MSTEGPTPWTPPPMPGPTPGGWQPPPAPSPWPPVGPPTQPPKNHDLRNVLIVLCCVLVIGALGIGGAVVATSRHNKDDRAASGSTSSTTANAGTKRFRPTSSVALENIGTQLGDLGANWADYGPVRTSIDLANPPADCAAYAPVFTNRDAGALRQFSLNPTANTEEGGLASVVVENASTAGVAALLPAVRQDAYAPCAEATAQRWLLTDQIVSSIVALHATPIDLVRAPDVAGWRSTVDYANSTGTHTFGMDIFYVAAQHYAVKLRFALCPCQPQPGAHLALVPDEVQAVLAVQQRVEHANANGGSSAKVGLPTPTDPPLPLADPCQLVADARVSAVTGGAQPSRTSVGDGTVECTWNGPTGSVVIQSGDSLTLFQTRIHDTPQALAGLGDQAYVDPEFPGKVLVRKGNRWIWVFVEYTAHDRDNAIKIAREALAKL